MEPEDLSLEKTRPRSPSFLRTSFDFILEIVKIVVFSLAIILPVRYFLIQPFYVKGASMEPTFLDKDYLIIYEADFRIFKEMPQRGEVIVFRYPKDPKQYFIKRVIGLPDETVEIRGGNVYIMNDQNSSGTRLIEEYLPEREETEVQKGSMRVTLGRNEYFVMGDNRGQSLDSRSFGPIPYDMIVGRTWVRGFPFHRIGTFQNPEYDFE